MFVFLSCLLVSAFFTYLLIYFVLLPVPSSFTKFPSSFLFFILYLLALDSFLTCLPIYLSVFFSFSTREVFMSPVLPNLSLTTYLSALCSVGNSFCLPTYKPTYLQPVYLSAYLPVFLLTCVFPYLLCLFSKLPVYPST